MKLTTLFEALNTHVKEIKKSDEEGITAAAEFINRYNQLTWQLNHNRLIKKLGARGRLFGLYAGTELVGTIAIKDYDHPEYNVGEIGYLAIAEEARTFQNYMKLHREAERKASRYDVLFMTTRYDNKTITKLLERHPKVIHAFRAKSEFGSNILNYWVFTDSDISTEEAINLLRLDVGSRVR